MTVQDLIAQLQMIEDKSATVVVDQIVVKWVVCDKQVIEVGENIQYIWLYN